MLCGAVMLNSVLNYIHIYLSRPTVVLMDVFLLLLGVSVLVGVIILKRRINNLAISIEILGDRITKGKS